MVSKLTLIILSGYFNEKHMKPIGIDLGTTYSAIASWRDSGLELGPVCYYFPQENAYDIASKIYIPDLTNPDEAIFGRNAIKRYFLDPDKFYSAFKRGMDKNTSYDRGQNGCITAVQLSTLLLKYMMKEVNKVEGCDFIPEGAVVSIPYYFLEPSKINTCEALSKSLEQVYAANLEYKDTINLRTIQEPIAAGLDYAFSNSDRLSKSNILIFDLGGGTFDVTIYELDNNTASKKLVFTVLATDGAQRLGGEDFDAAIKDYVLAKNGITSEVVNDPQNKTNLATLNYYITETKCRLSYTADDTIVINNFIPDFRITDKDIANILKGERGYGEKDYLSEIEDIVDRCLRTAGLRTAEIDRVVLVGGSSNIPCIRMMLENKFGKDKMYQSPKPSETVARGACIWAAYQLDLINRKDPHYQRHLHYWDKIEVKIKTAHSIGVVMANDVVDNLIASNQFTPVSSTRKYIPSSLNADGSKAELEPLTVKQGHAIIGQIPVPPIYTHGRARTEIIISITVVAEPTYVKVIVNVPRGNQDGTDLHTEEQIQIL